jgi:Zn-dependent protease
MTGFTVRLTGGAFFLALLATAVGALSLSAAAPGRTAAAYMAAGVAVAAALLLSLILHEVGHALVARRHGAHTRGSPTRDISVGFFGTSAHGSYDLPGPRGQWRSAAAGPAVSLGLAALAAAAAFGLAALGVDRLAMLVLAAVALINGALGVISLLPGAGPDGGRIVRALTWARTGNPAKADLVAARAAQVTGIALVAGGVTVVALGHITGLWLALIGFLAFAAARAQLRRLLVVAALAGMRVSDIVPVRAPVAAAAAPDSTAPDATGPDATGPDAAASDTTTPHTAGTASNPPASWQSWQTVESFMAEQGLTGAAPGGMMMQPAAAVFPLHDFDGRPAGLLTLTQLATVPPDRREALRLREIATPVEFLVTTTADEPLTGLMDRLSGLPRVPAAVHTAGHALILDADGRLAGVVTPADLARAGQVGALRRAADRAADRSAAAGGSTGLL